MSGITFGRGGPTLLQEGPGEFRCEECGRRCTRGPDGTEYGHERGHTTNKVRCSRRPDVCDPERSPGR